MINSEQDQKKIRKSKRYLWKHICSLGRRELTLNAFKKGIFPIKEKQRKGLKILTPKQMSQRLAIALAQVKVDNTSENLLNEIRQMIYSLYQAKKFTKGVYNNMINSVKI